MLRVIRYVVLIECSRTVGVGVGVDTEYRVVAGLARPHPVVGLASELTHRLWNGEHQTQVAECAVGSGVVLVALVERLYFQVESLVLSVYLLDHLVLHLVQELGALVVGHVLDATLLQFGCDVLLFHHEAYEHALVGQLLGERLGIESVEHVVVLYGRMRTDGLKTTVVVGQHESVGRYDNARAVAREVDNRLHDGVFALVQLLVGSRESVSLHLLVHCMWQVVERPHAFVGMCGG